MLPKVTIVTPSFNQAKYLEQTIISVLNQDYPNIEYIIIDGGSTDGSVEIIKKYQEKLSYWISEPDKGQSNAINKGFKHATGKIYNWLNSDDLLMPSAVKIAVYYLNKYPEVGLIYGNRTVIDGKGNFLYLLERPSFNPKVFPHQWGIPQETAFFRRECWQITKGLYESLQYCMDDDLFFRLSKITRFYHVPFVLGTFRRHTQSKTVLHSGALKGVRRTEFAKVYFKNYGRKHSKIKSKFYKFYIRLMLHWEKRSKIYKHEVDNIMRIIDTDIDSVE